MGGVGDELPPGALRLLQPVHQVVELSGNLGELIVPREDGPLVIGPLPHPPYGGLKAVQPLGELVGEHRAHGQHQHRHADGDGQQVIAQCLQQGGLPGVELVDVHPADDLVAVEHRLGGGGVEGPLLVDAVHGAVAPQGLHQLVVEHVVPRGVARLPGVVEHLPVGVGDDGSGDALRLHRREGLGHVLLRQLLQPRHGGVEGRGAAEQVGPLGAEDQVLADQQRIGVHQQDHDEDNGDVAGADLQLQRNSNP